MSSEHGHILVVDDNRMNRLKLSLGLEQQGHRVSLAEDGEQALRMVRSESFDAVLLDIVMPKMDGFQVLEQMKSDPALRDIPVIVISGLDETGAAVRCIEEGAEDFLPKAFNPVLLRARLNASLQKKRLRDLEKAYLRQEMTLRQSEKLATLGRLSAGMAHELNNPASAAQRGAAQLFEVFSRLQQAHLGLGELGLTDEQVRSLLDLDRLAQERARQPIDMNSLDRGDREREIEEWLEARGVEEPWDVAPALVNLGYRPDELGALFADLAPSQFCPVIDWLGSTFEIYSLLNEIHEGTGRIGEIVKALKAYTYMDRAPVQAVSVHEGLDSTLVILRSKLKGGVMVHREYAADLPRIQAYGGELNQVWTNLIDNAIDAMGGVGEIRLRTRREGAWVVVEVEDSGPGIPEAIRASIFDPFFTTKEPGRGTGLGLGIVHSIVERHRGRIEVRSRPGQTVFEVTLPVNANLGAPDSTGSITSNDDEAV